MSKTILHVSIDWAKPLCKGMVQTYETYYLPITRTALYLNKLECSLLQNALCQHSVETGLVICQCIFAVIFPYKNNHFSLMMPYANFGWNCAWSSTWFLRRLKYEIQTEGWTGRWQTSEKIKSFQLRWAIQKTIVTCFKGNQKSI